MRDVNDVPGQFRLRCWTASATAAAHSSARRTLPADTVGAAVKPQLQIISPGLTCGAKVALSAGLPGSGCAGSLSGGMDRVPPFIRVATTVQGDTLFQGISQVSSCT